MAIKIDVSKIEGYAEMTPEQKVAALEEHELEDQSSEIERYKNSVSKLSSEVAEWKRKHKESLTEDEQKKAETEESINAMRSELEELRKGKTISEYTAKYIAQGYDEVLAAESAIAMAEGNMDIVFGNSKIFIENREKALKSDLLKQTPTPPIGGQPDEPNNLDIATSIGKARAESMKTANETINYYTGGKE